MNLRRAPLGIALSAFLVTLVSLLGILASEGRAAAEPGDVSTAVLGFEALDGAPDNVAAEITDALRQRVAATHGYQLVQGKDLVEVKLVFSCPDEAPACMAQAGKSMGAIKLVFGNIKRSGVDYQVTIKLLDVNRGTVEAWATEAIPRRRAEPTVFRSLAPVWLAKLTGKGTGGSLAIRANIVGAAVSLDGTRVGVTGTQPVVIADVSPGRHEVSIEKSGYTNTTQEFTLASGQSLPLSLALSPVSVEVGAAPTETSPVIVKLPGETSEPPSSKPRDGFQTVARAGFWVAVVGTFALAGAGLKFAKDVQQINSDLDQYRRVPCPSSVPTSSSAVCDTHGNVQQPRTAMQNLIVANKTDQGRHDQVLEEVFFGLAVPVAIAGGYFLYKGYLDSGNETTAASRGLRIFPTASASAGGVSAGGIVTEFDF
jgi:PEGA domain